MGIDKHRKHHRPQHNQPETNSEDPYRRLLIKLYKFLVRRTSSSLNKKILKKLCYTKVNRQPVSLSKIFFATEKAKDSDIAVVVATVVNDDRLFDFPRRIVCALKFSEAARQRIEKAGGRCLTFDQLAIERPTGSNCLLLSSSRFGTEAYSHFRGIRGKHVVPYATKHAKRRNEERARGRRASRGGQWNH
eukprot:TRINITY_DN1227_c0_g3_i1.p1 TRINITY_DN1227_c0_g3~~TRINITY_DN1227_c0_g3_i1.p1  ORF type:complete len:190 (+),score=30.89 TRINITY_DN1227_c0_g3_i1:19-588(+)